MTVGGVGGNNGFGAVGVQVGHEENEEVNGGGGGTPAGGQKGREVVIA